MDCKWVFVKRLVDAVRMALSAAMLAQGRFTLSRQVKKEFFTGLLCLPIPISLVIANSL